MDNRLKKIYDNILIKKEKENNFRLKIPKNRLDNVVVYYKTKEDYIQDCNNLFQKIVPKKERIKRTISEKTLNDVLENYIYFKLLKERKIDQKNLSLTKEQISIFLKELKKCENDFKNYVLEIYPLKEFEVFNRMYNIKLDKKEELGIYTLYKCPEDKNDIKLYLEHLEKCHQIPSEVIIKTVVQARDSDSAKELARQKNEELIDIINFARKSYISIEEDYNITGAYTTISSNNGIMDYIQEEFPKTLDYDDLKKSYIYYKLFPLTQKEKLNFLENKIMISLHWYREFLHEKNDMNCLLKGVISLENLISTKKLTEKNGIQDYILKIVKVILKKDDDKKFTKILKDLYDKRSKIVHEGIAEVNFFDKFFLINLIEEVIEELISNSEYKNLRTKNEYEEFFYKITEDNLEKN